MILSRKMKILLLAPIAVGLGLEAASELAGMDSLSLIPPAQAVVGRPLTPVSVAGVARRTARRCAAGVYNC